MRGKIFTHQEADKMIPLVRRIVVNARARHRLLLRKQEQLLALPAARENAPAQDAVREALIRASRRLREELKSYTQELESLGCVLRDAEEGIVECYGDLKGDIVYFTWEPSHDSFQSWHPLDQSYINRQPFLDARPVSSVRTTDAQ